MEQQVEGNRENCGEEQIIGTFNPQSKAFRKAEIACQVIIATALLNDSVRCYLPLSMPGYFGWILVCLSAVSGIIFLLLRWTNSKVTFGAVLFFVNLIFPAYHAIVNFMGLSRP